MDSRILELLHQIELEYGSVAKCPIGDPRLLKARTILLSTEESQTIQATVEDLINRGYSVVDIASKVKVDKRKVYEFIKQYQLVVKPVFKYLAIKKKQRIYATSMASLARAIGCKAKFSEIKQTGWFLWRKRKRWEEISDGSYYVDEHDMIYIKRGLDSYRKHRIYNLME